MLFILELANNHGGNLILGVKIINAFYAVTKKFPQFRFAFKFQRRNLEQLIHPDYQDRMDIKYIKRFTEAQLTLEELYALKVLAKDLGFITICTPFDDKSVEDIQQLGFDYIKIASCCLTDWPLLNKIAEASLPIIASTGGANEYDVDKVVSFFNNRKIPLSLMHCIGLYPTMPNQLDLNSIDCFKHCYPMMAIGFSTHEEPTNLDAIKMAIAKGAVIFEKHVALTNVNAYSVTPEQYEAYLPSATQAIKMLYRQPNDLTIESDSLRQLKRGAWLRHDVKAGDKITRQDLFYAIPIQEGQISTDQCSKYTSFTFKKDCGANAPLMREDVNVSSNQDKLMDITRTVVTMLKRENIAYPKKGQLEISHHHGLEQFHRIGVSMITLINGVYCKKLLILLPGQTCPIHRHSVKDETFFVLAGKASIQVGDNTSECIVGDMVNVPPNSWHSLTSDSGVVIEEVSSTHNKSDSEYLSNDINKNPDRKTLVYLL